MVRVIHRVALRPQDDEATVAEVRRDVSDLESSYSVAGGLRFQCETERVARRVTLRWQVRKSGPIGEDTCHLGQPREWICQVVQAVVDSDGVEGLVVVRQALHIRNHG